MDILVDEIFARHSSNQEELTFDEWSQWFLSLDGMKDVLELRPHGTNQKQPGLNKSAMNTSQSYGANGGRSNNNRSRERTGIVGVDKNSSFNSGMHGGAR